MSRQLISILPKVKMICVIGVRSILVIFSIILKFGCQTQAFRLPGFQDLLQIAEMFPQNTVTHPPEETEVTVALCNLKTVQPNCLKIQ